MPTYKILNSDGDVVNTIEADKAFVDEHHSGKYELVVPPAPTEEQLTEIAHREAREWRDSELVATDQASQTPDWPNRDNILTYRTALRDWPATDDFPDTKPNIGG